MEERVIDRSPAKSSSSAPVFKSYEIPKKYKRDLEDKDLIGEINKRLQTLELIHSILDTPKTSRKSVAILE